MKLTHLLTVMLLCAAAGPLPGQAAATGCLRVTVGNWCLGADAKTVEMCAVLAYQNTRPVAGGYTDSAGGCTLTDLPPGQYQLVFTRRDYHPDTLEIAVPPNGGCVSAFVLLETFSSYASVETKHWFTGRSVIRCRHYPRPSQMPPRRLRTIRKQQA